MNHSCKLPADFSARVKSLAIEASGWFLVAVGVAALVLPGPGLLFLAGGLAVLALRYTWAKRLLRPIKAKAYLLAAKSVQTRPRIVFSILGVLTLAAVGILWGLGPPVPGWWPLANSWWLVGGWGTGVTLICSGGIALALVIYSYRNFRPRVANPAPLPMPAPLP